MQRKTGARGLRTILETRAARHHVRPAVAAQRVAKVVIDEAVIDGQTKPYIVYRSDESRLASVEEPRRAAGSNTTDAARQSTAPANWRQRCRALDSALKHDRRSLHFPLH